MALNPLIPLSVKPPAPLPDPMTTLSSVLEVQNLKAELDDRRLKQQKQAQLEALAQQYGDDPERFLQELGRIDPAAALAGRKSWEEVRGKFGENAARELKLEADSLTQARELVRLATPETWTQVVERAAELAGPQNGPILRQVLGPTYNPEVLQRIDQTLVSAEKMHEAKQKGLEFLLKGDLIKATATVLSVASTPQLWEMGLKTARDAAIGYGMPAAQVDEQLATFGPWSPDAPARAAQLALTEKERAELTGQAATRAESARHNKVVEAQGWREPLETIIGPDGKPVLVPRSKAAGKTPATKPEALVKVPTYNKETGEWNYRWVTPTEGMEYPVMPTADMRNRADAVKGLVPMFKQMRQYSDSIITRIGPAQRADAAKRGVEAVFGTDPDFTVYRDFRGSLAVMLAVAAQGSRPSDADVFRAALPMVPNPYSDTEVSAKKKWDLITAMFQTRLSPEAKRELGLTEGSGFSVTAPNGKTYTFKTQQELDAFKRAAGMQ